MSEEKDHKFEDKDDLLFDDDDLFAPEEGGEGDVHPSQASKWKVMIVDDEVEVHNVTKMVMSNFSFDGLGLEFISAYSGKEAREKISEHPDAALTLLDVVMEEEDAGLKVVKHIREELQNTFVRIILRTGQPGQAPEKKVIVDYDINDYKAKTELTTQKLFTAIIASLRSYRDIMTIESNKKGLVRIIDASANIFKVNNLGGFVPEILGQSSDLFTRETSGAIIGNLSGFAAEKRDGEFFVMAGTGRFEDKGGQQVEDLLSEEHKDGFKNLLSEKGGKYFGDTYMARLAANNGAENVYFMEGWKGLNDWEVNLVEIFYTNLAIAYDNLNLHQEIEDTQKEILFTMSEIAEARSKETGNHVERVSEICRVMGLKAGLPEKEANLLKMASTMHDIGKLGVPDAILNKPGKLTEDEFKIMKEHATIGYEMLKSSDRQIIKTAAIIAHQHQEKYNGKGYPRGLKGDDIHIYARICAIADVFDALACERVYKKAWPIEKIIDLFQQEGGDHFDPNLTSLFLENIGDFVEIKDHLKDALPDH